MNDTIQIEVSPSSAVADHIRTLQDEVTTAITKFNENTGSIFSVSVEQVYNIHSTAFCGEIKHYVGCKVKIELA